MPNRLAPDPGILNALRAPTLRLHGSVEESWIDRLIKAAETSDAALPFVIEVMTTGGDAEVGRRLALEICLMREQGRTVLFLGKTCVYSAGSVFMGCFAREERWLSEDCQLLIHERQLTKTVNLDGPLTACRSQLEKAVTEVETGLKLQRKGYEDLAAGSRLSADEIEQRALTNWYLTAQEALELGLVAGLFKG